MSLISTCELIARRAHCGQTRNDGKTPYIEHPAAVSRLVGSVDEKCIAWLHDVVEDCVGYEIDILEANGVPQNIIDAVDILTHLEGSYLDYILSIKESKNRLAINVKLADMDHNSSEGTSSQQTKYELSKYILLS